MTAMSRGKKGYESIYVPTRTRGLVQRSTGTNLRAVVAGMKRMVKALKARALVSGNWAILDAIQANRVRLLDVYPHYVANTLSTLETTLSAANLSEHLTGWIGWVRANRRDDVRTADVYWQQVTTLIVPGTPFPSSELTKARVIAWLASRDKATSGTKRKYLYALKSFVRYLLDITVLTTDPLAGLRAPKKNPARERWETIATDERIVANALPEYRAFFAFVKGTGCDVGSAQRAQKADINLFAQTVNLRGTKTDRRRVHSAALEAWAVPYLKARLNAMRHEDGHALLFPNVTRTNAASHHRNVCRKVGVSDYTLKDARHSVGVRMRLAGKSFEEIAAQLGTSVYQTVNVYSRYKPEDAQRAKEAQ